MVGINLSILIFNHFFDHNLNFKSPHGKCNPFVDIQASYIFSDIKKTQFGQGLLFALLSQKFKTFQDYNSQNDFHLGIFDSPSLHFTTFMKMCASLRTPF